MNKVVYVLLFLFLLGFKSSVSAEGLSFEESTYSDTTHCCPKGTVGVILDRYFSPVTGASALNSILYSYISLDDYLFPSTEGDRNAYMMLGRFGKLVLENLLFTTGMVAQHEIFGHGWRAREFNLKVYEYSVRPWGGYTVFSASQFNRLPLQKQIAVTAGGVEATGVLAKILRDRFLENKSLDEREAHFYILNNMDQTLYILGTRHEKTFSTDNDIQAYVQEVNQWFNRPVLTTDKLRKQVLVDFLDPYFWYSLYGLGAYIFQGTQCFEYPMIPIGDYHYLPGMRLALTPYGTEYQFRNYLRGCDHTYQATLRYGNTGGKTSGGLILEATRLWVDNCLSFDGRVDLWVQPKLFTPSAATANRQLGGALSLTAHYRIVPNFELRGQLGYKTKGYMPGGEGLKNGILARIGFFVHL